MTDQGAYSRRHFLAATAAASAIAGCSSGDGGEESTTEPRANTDSPGDTEPVTATSVRGDPATTESAGSDAQTPDSSANVDVTRDVIFREGPDWSLAMDLYLPGASDAPFVVFAHGGGWFAGDKRRRPMFPAMAEAGIAVADIQYRLVPDFQYPAAVRDTVAAVKYVRANAGEYDLDAERGALAGYSAGAHLAVLVGLAPDHENFQPVNYLPEEPVGVDAIVGYSGPYDFTVPGARENGMVAGFFGQDASEETLAEGSPTTHVDGEDPPTMLVHGTDDGIVPYRSTTVLAGTLEDAGVPTEVVTGDGAGHGMIDDPEWREETLPAQREFLGEHLV